jgi:transmembrane sensor
MSSAENSNRSSAAAEAADWYARLRAQDVTEIDGLRFRAWISGAPERRQEFEALEKLWQGLGQLEQSPAMQRTREAITARRRRNAHPRARRQLAIAAAAILSVGTSTWFWQQLTLDVYVTDVGELRTIPLDDGSVVTLNTATKVKFDYSESTRRVELLKGQASFEVAKDPGRPFVVSVAGGEVRALGTVFDVYKENDKVTVTLLEGKVTVSPSIPQPDDAGDVTSQGSALRSEVQPLVLSPGEQISYEPTVISETLAPITIAAVDVRRVTAWRARKLAFRDTLLTDAIAEANRYSNDQIVLEAPGLTTARLSGSFEAGKNEIFAEGLRTFFGFKVARRSDGTIILTQAPE